jgi:hypothetical protein
MQNAKLLAEAGVLVRDGAHELGVIEHDGDEHLDRPDRSHGGDQMRPGEAPERSNLFKSNLFKRKRALSARPRDGL